MIELKPCPFCGGNPKLYESYPMEWFVCCLDCDVETAHNGKEQAIAAWNRRAGDTGREFWGIREVANISPEGKKQYRWVLYDGPGSSVYPLSKIETIMICLREVKK